MFGLGNLSAAIHRLVASLNATSDLLDSVVADARQSVESRQRPLLPDRSESETTELEAVGNGKRRKS